MSGCERCLVHTLLEASKIERNYYGTGSGVQSCSDFYIVHTHTRCIPMYTIRALIAQYSSSLNNNYTENISRQVSLNLLSPLCVFGYTDRTLSHVLRDDVQLTNCRSHLTYCNLLLLHDSPNKDTHSAMDYPPV